MQAFRLRRVYHSTNTQQAKCKGLEPSRPYGQRIFNCNPLQHSRLVHERGFEPPRGCPHQHLKLARLPFRHSCIIHFYSKTSTMDRTLQDFEDTLIARNLVARVVEATEFPTEEARKKYLQSHPKANPANHTVRKNKTPTQFKRTDKTRWDDVLKNTKGLKELGEKANKGDEAAKAEVSKRYTALVDHGESMADDAKPLISKLKGNAKLGPDAKEHLGKLEAALKKWDSISHAAQKAKGRNTEAQLQHANDVMSVAGDIRTLTHWLQGAAIKDKAMKRSADEWKA